MHNVFIYDSLKSDQSDRHVLKKFEGINATAENIVLHGRKIPFAVRGPGIAIGEVYEVDDETLEMLDDLKSHPEWYHRELTTVCLIGGRKTQAWIYLNDEAYIYPQVVDNDWQG